MNKHTEFKTKTQIRESARRLRQRKANTGAPPRRAPLPRQVDHRG